MAFAHRPGKPNARTPLIIGFACVALLVGVLGIWGSTTQISGAIIATGTIRAESDHQIIQHPEGGVVGEIHVRSGDMVQAGQVLVRLDDVFIRSELAVVEGQILELTTRLARLRAERDRQAEIRFPPSSDYSEIEPHWIKAQQAGQSELFEARKTSLAQETSQLEEKRRQISGQIHGSAIQIDALNRQLDLIRIEASGLQGLSEQGLVPLARVLGLQREEARLQGEIGRLNASAADAGSRVAGISIELIRLGDQRREQAITTMRDLRYSAIDLEEQRAILRKRLARLDIRAPVSGSVFESRVSTLQSVVKAGQIMMYIVPDNQSLLVSARIAPNHVDQVFPGQQVSLRLTPFDPRDTPEISGIVRRISADVVTDNAARVSYYEAIIIPDADLFTTRPRFEPLPGMPVEVFLKTRDRTPLSYLVDPLASYFFRAFREG